MVFRALILLMACSMVCFVEAPTHAEEPAMPGATKSEEQILVDHVHEIFQAFLARDRDRLRELHTEDWVGFLGPSTGIERGLADYMVNANRSLDSFRGTDYEIHDTEVQIHGDIALVFYVATYFCTDASGDDTPREIPLRSVDVFRRDDGRWNQSASHIAVVPSGGKWGEGTQE